MTNRLDKFSYLYLAAAQSCTGACSLSCPAGEDAQDSISRGSVEVLQLKVKTSQQEIHLFYTLKVKPLANDHMTVTLGSLVLHIEGGQDISSRGSVAVCKSYTARSVLVWNMQGPRFFSKQ